MIDDDINIKAVSKYLGHFNISIIGYIYGHIFDEYETKISNAIV